MKELPFETRHEALRSGTIDYETHILRIDGMAVVLRVNDPRPDDVPLACISYDPEVLKSNRHIWGWIKSVLKKYGGQAILCPTKPDEDFTMIIRGRLIHRE